MPEDRIPAINQEFAFYPGNENGNSNGHGGEQTAAGNWGLLNLDGGSNTISELIDWIENGYPVGVVPRVRLLPTILEPRGRLFGQRLGVFQRPRGC